jgi:hypothetical protein
MLFLGRKIKRPLLAGQARQAWGFFLQGFLGYDSETAEKNFLPYPLKLVFLNYINVIFIN